jgi:hypothetical protein
MLEEIEIQKIAEAVVELLDKRHFISKKEKIVRNKIIDKTDTFKKNQETLNELKEKEFIKDEYNLTENTYGWKYLINKGKGISVEKYIVALYWKGKQKKKALRDQYGYTFEFATKDMAMTQFLRDLPFAKQIADCVEFKDIPKLIEIADSKAYDDKSLKMYKWDWQISTLVKYINLL